MIQIVNQIGPESQDVKNHWNTANKNHKRKGSRWHFDKVHSLNLSFFKTISLMILCLGKFGDLSDSTCE